MQKLVRINIGFSGEAKFMQYGARRKVTYRRKITGLGLMGAV
jgi:hypothetical protein